MSGEDTERAQRAALLRSLRERLDRDDPTLWHGSLMLRNAGCGCDECAAAAEDYQVERQPEVRRRYLSRLRERLDRGDPTVPHGSDTYGVGCRCDECTAAASAKRIRVARRQGVGPRTWTDEEILDALRQVGPMRSARYRAWRADQSDRSGLPAHSLVLARFGGWTAAQQAAFRRGG